MRNFILLLLGLIAGNLAFSQNNKDSSFATNYVSLAVPLKFEGKISYLDSFSIVKDTDINKIKHDATILPSFSDLVSNVTIYKVDVEGNISLLGQSVAAKNSDYIVMYDYSQTQTINIDTDKISYSVLVGISVRMVAKIHTIGRNINLVNIYGLGAQASNNKVTGSLEVRSTGISSQEINSIIPVTADLSAASIASALQAVATIKSHIYDKDTKLTPQILAYSAVGVMSTEKSESTNTNKGKMQKSKNNYKTLLRTVKALRYQ